MADHLIIDQMSRQLVQKWINILLIDQRKKDQLKDLQIKRLHIPLTLQAMQIIIHSPTTRIQQFQRILTELSTSEISDCHVEARDEFFWIC